tara:strand:+ start:230 stop:667 length:438 start_codon:yes stop_codon:yes gene_type:complete
MAEEKTTSKKPRKKSGKLRKAWDNERGMWVFADGDKKGQRYVFDPPKRRPSDTRLLNAYLKQVADKLANPQRADMISQQELLKLYPFHTAKTLKDQLNKIRADLRVDGDQLPNLRVQPKKATPKKRVTRKDVDKALRKLLVKAKD